MSKACCFKQEGQGLGKEDKEEGAACGTPIGYSLTEPHKTDGCVLQKHLKKTLESYGKFCYCFFLFVCMLLLSLLLHHTRLQISVNL